MDRQAGPGSRPKVGGKSSYRGAAIYRNISRDGGATFGPDTKVADHSCECCRIALGVGSDGAMRALWRHVFEPNVRDHAFAVLRGETPADVVRATYDEWRVDGCPHHGPALAQAADGFHTVWFGIRQEGEDKVSVYATPGWPRTARPGCRRCAPCRMRAPNMPM